MDINNEYFRAIDDMKDKIIKYCDIKGVNKQRIELIAKELKSNYNKNN